MEFIFFLGRFHVLALHLPLGIIVAVVALDFFSKRPGNEKLSEAGSFLWGLAALTTIITVLLGMMHAQEGGFEGASFLYHRVFGVATAAVATAIWLLRVLNKSTFDRFLYITSGVILFLIAATGHYGGNLTHGSTYLVEYAPGLLQKLAGYTIREPVTDIAQADVFDDVVNPIIQRRCSSCHNPEKLKGGLSIASYTLMLKGGESGAAVVPGDTSTSEMYRRISLDGEHEDYMPADNKTPLTSEEMDLVSWWITAGAPDTGSFVDMKPDSDIQNTAMSFLGLSDAIDDKVDTATSLVANASSELIDQAREQGFQLRNVTQDSPLLFVDLSVRGGEITQEDIEVLNGLADQTYELSLKGTALTDELFAAMEPMPNLAKLELAKTGITDNSFDHIAAYPALEVLNLYAVPNMTEAGLEKFKLSTSVEKIYSWNLGTKP